ncbi:AAA family ATPase [bacterium]|nr:AAA family ATPase [bacterium]
MKIIGLPETKPNYITELDDEGYEKLQYKIKKYLNNYDDKEYKALKQAFDYYKSPEQGRIEFITFHQSYSYEEFVEGIKPDIDTCDWNEPVDKLTYKGTDGIFKVAANRALFDRLDIRIEQQGEILEFRSLKEKFIEEYGVGTTLKTNTKEAEFRIDKYTKNSARITPINGEYTYSITFKYLEEAYNKNMSSKNEIATINGVASGLAGYYYAIYEKLLKIKESDKSIEKTSNIKKMPEENKLQLVKDFYSGKINLNNLDSEPYVLIIDEINRGNISKIFGELITLIEEDKREKYSVTLPYSQEEFTVPKNLYIIGTMNTADRSIASVDIALRRRFTFKEMMPQPELIDENVICCNIDIKEMRRLLNKRICALLDRDHQIGHSYFLKLKNGANDKFKNIWFDNIMPLLNEYFYNDWEKLQAILGKAEGIDRNSFIEEIEINSDNFFAYETNPCDDNSYFDFRERSYFFDIEKGTERFVSAMRTAFASAYRE